MAQTKAKAKSKLANVPLVLATSQPYTKQNLPVHEVASYKCSCGHNGAVQASLDDPHCAKCGKVVTARITTSASVVRIENAGSTVSLHCASASCKAHNLMSTETALAFKGSICCASCGETLAYDTSELDDDVDLGNGTGSDDLVDNYDEEASLDDDDVDIDDLDEEADVEDEDDPSATDDYLGGDTLTNSEGEEFSDEDEDDEDDTALDGGTVSNPNAVSASLKRTTVLSTLRPTDLETARLVSEEDRIHLFVKNNCVASLSATPENKKVFGSKNHLRLILSSLQNKGVSQTATDFGFKLATYKVSKTKALASTVASIQATAEADLSAKIAEHAQVLRESLEIAALGFNRDAFAQELANPLKDAMHECLVRVGVDKVTAAFQVQEAFSVVGDAYVEALVKKAYEIAGHAPVVRSQLASTFASMSPPVPNLKALADTDDFDDESEEEACDDTDSYLGGGGTTLARLSSPMKSSVTASTGTEAQRTVSLFNKRTLSTFSRK